MDGNLSFFNEKAGYRSRGSSTVNEQGGAAKTHPTVASFHQRAAQYMTTTIKVSSKE